MNKTIAGHTARPEVIAMTYDELETKWKIKTPCSSGIGDGWVPLVDKLIIDLVALPMDPPFDPTKDIAQIKEKFGDLRFYPDRKLPEEAMELIQAAESKSYKTCEDCGEPGTSRRSGGWIRTLCDKCHLIDVVQRASRQ